MINIKDILQRLIAGGTLSSQEARDIVVGISNQAIPDLPTGAILTAIQMRGATVDEILGFRQGILDTGVPARLDAGDYIDVVGTGGDQKNTFNISTCACFVIAGAGYKVAKHGNYAATSVSGASDVIEGHGVKFTADIDRLNRSIDECGFVYLHAQLFARAMKCVAPVRKALPFPTVFNQLGPLVNPSQPRYQLLGVASLDQMRLYSSIYKKIGINYGIVNSIDGYDEISLTGDFKVTTNDVERLYTPAQLGLPVADPVNLRGGASKAEAVKIFDSVLRGTAADDQKNVVVANAAYGIGVMEPHMSIADTVLAARESLESGKALEVLKKYVALNS